MKPWIKHIRELMRLRGMTQEALANQLGKGQSWVNHKLSGRRKANVDDIILIANALDIEPSTLLKKVTNYEQLADNFIGIAEPEKIYQSGWISELTAGLEKLDKKEAKLFIDDTLSELDNRINKKGS